jgi:hypothetical protein
MWSFPAHDYDQFDFSALNDELAAVEPGQPLDRRDDVAGLMARLSSTFSWNSMSTTAAGVAR